MSRAYYFGNALFGSGLGSHAADAFAHALAGAQVQLQQEQAMRMQQEFARQCAQARAAADYQPGDENAIVGECREIKSIEHKP